MISEKFAKALSDQVNAEYYSAYLYLVMSAAADKMGLKGTASWLFVQAQEEMAHGTHIYEYILERDATPEFAPIALPPVEFDNITAIFREVQAHEAKVTQLINNLATIAMQDFDHAGYQFMTWYVGEQVEEEASVKLVLDKLHWIADNTGQLLNLDAELGTRVFVNPFPAKA